MMKYDEHCGTSYGVDGELMTVVDIMAQSATGQRVPRQNWSSCTAPLILDVAAARVMAWKHWRSPDIKFWTSSMCE